MENKINNKIILSINNLSYYFNYKSFNEVKALDNISFNFLNNKIYFIIGNSGCGKSTLVSHFNGLLKSRFGNLNIDGFEILGKNRKIKNPKVLRKKISMVFQFPEYQLFKDTIIDDVSFGPKILGIQKELNKKLNKDILLKYFLNNKDSLITFFKSKNIDFDFIDYDDLKNKINFSIKSKSIKNFYNKEDELNYKKNKKLIVDILYKEKSFRYIFIKKDFKLFYEEETLFNNSKKYLNLMGIDDSYFNKSPFGLSGGQKRRVAIAGILSINPKILVFDEPTAGLDPLGESEMMKIILDSKKSGKTVFVISHNMDHTLEVADEVLVMDNGKIVLSGDPFEIFLNKDLYEKYNLEMPKIIKFILELIAHNNLYKILLDIKPRSIEELSENIIKILKKKKVVNNEL